MHARSLLQLRGLIQKRLGMLMRGKICVSSEWLLVDVEQCAC